MAALQGRAVRKQELETAPVHQRSGTRAVRAGRGDRRGVCGVHLRGNK